MGPGLRAVALAAFGLSALDLLLYVGGHEPSMARGEVDPINGLAVSSYYLYQAAFAPLVLGVAWLIYGLLCLLLLRLIGVRPRAEGLFSALGLSLGVPMLLAYVLPDILIYVAYGFSALGAALPYYAPLCLIWWLSLGTLAVKRVGGVGWIAAGLIHLMAFLGQSILLGLFLR